MAWLLDGERRSNVVAFRITKKPLAGEKAAPAEVSTDFLRIILGEPRRAGMLPMIASIAHRASASDPSNVDLQGAALVIDGKSLTRKPAARGGAGFPPVLNVGDSAHGTIRWDAWQETVDPAKPHTIQIQAAGVLSKPVALVTATPLGDAWDAATTKLAPAPAPVIQVQGRVVDENGKSAVGYRVGLFAADGRSEPCEELTDASGHYEFAGIPPGSYELTCAPGAGSSPMAVVEKVVVPPQTIDVAFTGRFTIEGKVDLAEGGPAAGYLVRGTYESPDGQTTINVSATTDSAGHYTLKGPFERVQSVGVLSSPEPPEAKALTAPRGDVNFRLVSEEEERKRVR
jgi:hypothetical protein